MHLNLQKVKQLSLTTLLLSLIILATSQSTIVLADVGDTIRVSIASNGSQGNAGSYHPAISANGRFVAFASYASNLIAGDTNKVQDVFLHDIQSGVTALVSVSSSGTRGNGASHNPAISADGRYIAFVSSANNFVSGDTNHNSDIFLRDMLTNTTTRISVNSGGIEGNYNSDYPPSLSDDGRYVAFTSWSDNLVPGDTNGWPDAFIRDTKTNITALVSVAMDGTFTDDSANVTSMTPDGRYVVFYSESNELISGDTNGRTDVFLRDMHTNITTRISVSSNGEQGNGGSGNSRISADGRYISFGSSANNLVTGDTNDMQDVFLRDTQMNTTIRISVNSNGDQGNGTSYVGSLSADGRYILFMSGANNLVSGDSNSSFDIFMYDRQTNTTTLISQLPDGTQGNAESSSNSISADGHYTAFFSWANNLVADDTNSVPDIFFHENNIVLPTPTLTPKPLVLPAAGFAPNVETVLFMQPMDKAYTDESMWLEIPSLGVKQPIVGVPGPNWDVAWLGNNIGYLQGTAFPTWNGNSVLTGHATNANGKPGPFTSLGSLLWGSKVIIHAWEQQYIYEVRSVSLQTDPNSTSVLTKHEEISWLTLITCRGYNEKTNSYRWRTVVRAVLTEIK